MRVLPAAPDLPSFPQPLSHPPRPPAGHACACIGLARVYRCALALPARGVRITPVQRVHPAFNRARLKFCPFGPLMPSLSLCALRKLSTSACACVVGTCLLALATAGRAQTAEGPPSSGQAATVEPMTLTQAARAAVEWHPAVRTSVQEVLQAGEGTAAARAGYYPQVRGGIGSQISNGTIGAYDSRRVQTAALSVSQMLYDFGKVASAIGQAEASVAATRAQLLVSVDDVARETALAWLEVRRQQALGEIAREQVRGVQALADLVMERQRKGASSRSDVAQAQSRVEAARAQQLTADAQYARWKANLMQLTGAHLPIAVAQASPTALDGACHFVADVRTPHPPAVQLAQARRAVAQAALRAADAQLLPTLSLDGSIGRGLDARSRLPGDNAVTTTVGLNFSMPLYEGGGNQARQRAAAYALSAAEASLAQVLLSVRQSLDDAVTQSQGQAQRLPVLAARVQSIRDTRDLYQQQYLQLGSRSLLDLLNAEQEYHGARFEQAESEHELRRLDVHCLYQTDRLRTALAIDAPHVATAGSSN